MALLNAMCVVCDCDLVVLDEVYMEQGGEVYCMDCRPSQETIDLLKKRVAKEYEDA